VRRVLTVLAGGALLLAGCGVPSEPEVTFYAAGKTIRVSPVSYCDLRADNCADKGAPAELKVPAGQVVQISVPGQLAKGRWEVAYTYIDAATSDVVGKLSEEILGHGENYTYSLTVPNKADQLVRINVLEAAAAVMEDGSLATRGVWQVDVVPK
jgi:hypothetical protein